MQDSPVWEPTQQFLTMRAFGAPPIVIALAAQGTFRGFMDTKTPLYAVGKVSAAFSLPCFNRKVSSSVYSTLRRYVVVQLIWLFIFSYNFWVQNISSKHCVHNLLYCSENFFMWIMIWKFSVSIWTTHMVRCLYSYS